MSSPVWNRLIRGRPARPVAKTAGPSHAARLSLEGLECRITPATNIWIGVAGADWSPTGVEGETSTNWSLGRAPQDGDDLIFPNVLPSGVRVTNNNLTGLVLNSITFSNISAANAYTLGGNALGLGGTAEADRVIANAGALGNSITFDVLLGGSAARAVFNVDSGASVDLSGRLMDAGPSGPFVGLTKAGAGTLALTGDNSSYSGNIDISSGTLVATNPDALGNTTGDTTVQSGTTIGELQLVGFSGVLNETLRLTGVGVTGQGALRQLSGTSEIAGSVILNSANTAVGVDTGTMTISGLISDTVVASLSKEGVGQLILAHAGGNIYRGLTTVADGTLTIRDPGALGADTTATATNGTTVLSNPATGAAGTLQLDFDGFAVGNELLALGGGTLTNLRGVNAWRQPIILTDDARIDVQAGALTIGGGITDGGSGFGVTKIGPGRLEVTAAVGVGEYTARTTVTDGDLLVDGVIGDVRLATPAGALIGAGAVGQITGLNGNPVGLIAPGADTGTTDRFGKLTTAGGTLGNSTQLFIDLDSDAAGPGVGYDQLIVDGGTLDLNDVVLAGSATANGLNGDTFTIIQAVNGGQITGFFDEPFDPGEVYIGGQKFLLAYNRGPNGSVVLNRVLSAPAVALASSQNPSVFGEAVTFTATVTPEDAALFASGTPKVRFTLDLDGGAGVNNQQFDVNVTVSADRASGTAALTVQGLPNLGVGFHLVTAEFLGDDNQTTATSNGVTQEVRRAAATATLTADPTSSVFGQPVEFTATVAAVTPGVGTPTGTVTFYDGAVSAATQIGTTQTLTGGQASVAVSDLSRATHTIIAAYSGDSSFEPNDTGTNGTLDYTVNRADTATTVTVPPAAQVNLPGQSFAVSARVAVAAPGAVVLPNGRPTGTVTFRFNNGPGRAANVDLETGVATLSVGDLPPGTYTITAFYNGDGNFNASTSPTPQKTVTVSRIATAVAVTAGPSSVPANSPVTFTATASAAPPGGVPTGTVTFTVNGVAVATVALNGSGQATVTLPGLSSGPRTVGVAYAGDAIHLPSAGTVSFFVGSDVQELYAVGAGPGSAADNGTPAIKVYDARTGVEVNSFLAYTAPYAGGVRVAVGDVTGDGYSDILTTTTAGTEGGHVKVFDGRTFAEVHSFLAMPGVSSGFYIAAGDVNGDGRADIIVGGDLGDPNGHVKVFDGVTLAVLFEARVFDNFLGGVRVSAGDVDGDGRADVIVASGFGATPHVKVFSGANFGLIHSFLAFAQAFQGGVFAAAANADGDRFADIVIAASGIPHVKVFSGLDLAERASFIVPDPTGLFTTGSVGAADRTGDGVANLLLAFNGVPSSKVLAIDPFTQFSLAETVVFPGYQGPIFVGS